MINNKECKLNNCRIETPYEFYSSLDASSISEKDVEYAFSIDANYEIGIVRNDDIMLLNGTTERGKLSASGMLKVAQNPKYDKKLNVPSSRDPFIVNIVQIDNNQINIRTTIPLFAMTK